MRRFLLSDRKVEIQDFPEGLVVKTSCFLDFPVGSVIKNPPANAGDTGSAPDPARSRRPWSYQTCAPQLLSPGSRVHVLQ